VSKSPFRVVGIILVWFLVIVTLIPQRLNAEPPLPTVAELKARLWLGESPGWVPAVLHQEVETVEPSTHLGGEREESSLPAWTRLVFQSYRDGNWEIYLAQGDGTQPVRLTDHPASDSRPRLNRGGTRVVFSSNRDGNAKIFTMNADGSDLSRLTDRGTPDIYPVWSPDSKQIAFTSRRDDNWEIYVMNADGSAQHRLTYDNADDVMPAWSPDGSQIAWVRRTGFDGTLWVMNANGTNPHPISGLLRFLQNPAWSPDGNFLAFDCDSDGDAWSELGLLAVDGSSMLTVYDPSEDLVDAWMGSWSPDGLWLLFSRVEYVVHDQQLYLKNTYLERKVTTYVLKERFATSGFDLFPDIQSMDLQPPVARVHRLPRLSSAHGFTVTWSGQDVGPAGIGGYEIQYRAGLTGPWLDWLANTLETSSPFRGMPGHTYAFRARAWDNALNQQAWIGEQPDTETTLYTWQIKGSVWDVRGIPMPGLPVAIAPDPLLPILTQVDGQYQGYLQADGQHTVTLNRAGYGKAMMMLLNSTGDAIADHVLPPPDDRVQDGSFEGGALTPAWHIAGDPTPTLSTEIRHTGEHAVVLGKSYSLTTSQATAHGSFPLVAVDDNQVVHLVMMVPLSSESYAIQYTSKPVTGTWPITPTTILTAENQGYPYTWGTGIAMVPDGSGGIHLAYEMREPDSGYMNVFFCHKPATANQCTTPINMTNSEVMNNGGPQLLRDYQGGLHLFWRSDMGIWYHTYQPPNGVWETPQATKAPGGAIAIDSLGTFHAVWQASADSGLAQDILYSSKPAGGDWSEPIRVVQTRLQSTWPSPQMGVAPDGTVHLLWQAEKSFVYASKSPGGQWSAPTDIAQLADISWEYQNHRRLAVDSSGRIHVVYITGKSAEQTKLVYLAKRPEGHWKQIAVAQFVPAWIFTLAVDRLGVIHVIWKKLPWEDNSVYHTQTAVAPTDAELSVSQMVAIPPETHRATVSLLYNLEPWQAGDTRFHVILSNEFTSIQVASPSAAAEGWVHAWADVSAWAGQTVNLTIGLHQKAGSPFNQIYLDDITLGSWVTPVIHQIAPSFIDPSQATRITLTGENFFATPTLRVNDKFLDCIWLDEHTLQATLPPGLTSGIYDVWVTNPGGQVGVFPSGLRIGSQIYLPVLYRKFEP